MNELLQTRLQVCDLLARLGQMQVQNASLLREKLDREIAESQAAEAQKAHDAAVDASDRKTGAPTEDKQ